jgi:hypothetical protein
MPKWFKLIMSDDCASENAIFPDSIDFNGVEVEELRRGKRFDQWKPKSVARSTATSRDGNAVDVVFAGLAMVPLFSPRLQQTLLAKSVGVHDIQYLPIVICQSTGESITGFAVANVVSRVAALDRARCFLLDEDESEIDPETHLAKISSVGKLALRNVPGLFEHDVVRLIEFSSAILVSERFVNAFRACRYTGAHFSELDISPKIARTN